MAQGPCCLIWKVVYVGYGRCWSTCLPTFSDDLVNTQHQHLVRSDSTSSGSLTLDEEAAATIFDLETLDKVAAIKARIRTQLAAREAACRGA